MIGLPSCRPALIVLGLVENDTAVKRVVIACTGETDNEKGIDDELDEEELDDNADEEVANSGLLFEADSLEEFF